MLRSFLRNRRSNKTRQDFRSWRPSWERLEDRAQPAIFTVTNVLDSGVGSLRDAITSANSAAGADIIDATGVAGTISLITVLPTISGETLINGPGAAKLTVQRDPTAANFRIFNINDGTPTVISVGLDGMTISNGAESSGGGGIRIESEKVTLSNSVLSGNSAAGPGGGIFAASNTNLTVINSSISGNTGGNRGGGSYFYAEGRCTIIGSTVSGNVANERGAGLYFWGSSQNTAIWTIQNCTISGNSLMGVNPGTFVAGGGVGTFGPANRTFVQATTITKNTAAYGSGLYNQSSGDLTTIESSVISGNTATGFGGVYSYGTVTLKSSLISDSAGNGGVFTDLGGNLANGTDPMLAPLADNGGPTLTHLPLPGSPLINAGFNSLAQGIDQRGFQRTVGGLVDIGPVEFNGSQPSGTVPTSDLITNFGATSYKFSVVYRDETAVQVSSFGSNDLTVTGPGGALTFVSVTSDQPTDGPTRVATYTFTPPGGSWDLSDNGTYLIQSVDGQVTDTTANGITNGIIGSFKVQLNVVTNTNDSGPGSLRQAILDSNASVGELNTIAFAVGSGPITITPMSPLPKITDPVIIDGTTQPGVTASPIVQITGTSAGAGAIGLDLVAAGNTIKGLVINGFSTGSGIRISGVSNNNTIQFNILGANLTGSAGVPNAVGLEMGGTISGNLIGTDLNNVNDDAERNLISGNSVAGIRTGVIGSPFRLFQWTTGPGANGHYYVATPASSWDAGEAVAVANGGHLASITSAEETNFILQNVLPAVDGNAWIGGTDSAVEGTFAWTTGEPFTYTNWSPGEPNDFGAGEDLLELVGNGRWNDNSAGIRRTILEFESYPDLTAIANGFGVVANRIQGNGIGTNILSSGAVPNTVGIELGASSNVTIRENLISGNTNEGIKYTSVPNIPTNQWTSGTGANNHYYMLTPPMLFGTAEAAAVAAGGHLASITSAEEQAFLEATFRPALGNNVAWMGFTDFGQATNNFVWLTGEPVTYTNWAPGEPNDSGDFGVFNFNNNGQWDDNGDNSPRPTIMEFNTPPNQAVLAGIFGNGGNNLIVGNYIGTNRTGTAKIANGTGIELGNSAGVTIRSNLISGSTGDGVKATTSFSLPSVQWTTGTGANNHYYVLAPQSTFVYAEAAAVAAGGHLVSITSLDEETFLTSQYFVTLSGKDAWMGFSDAGFAANDFHWLTGEPTVYTNWAPGEPNNSGDYAVFNYQGEMKWDDTVDGVRAAVLEFNSPPDQNALALFYATSGLHNIVGNSLGSNAALTGAIPNNGNAINLSNVRNVIVGGTTSAAANLIRSNGGAGVVVTGSNSSGVAIRGNAIFGNTGLPVDLGTTGATPNDYRDTDTGPNGLQNKPVLGAAAAGGSTFISGVFNGTPNATLTLDVYAAAITGVHRYLGSATIVTDALGNAIINTIIPAASSAGETIFATAVDAAGNTSEYSAGVVAGTDSPPSVSSLVVNNGATQRSRVTRIDVNFASPVNAAQFQAAGAVFLTRTSGGTIGTTIDTSNGLIIAPATGTVSSITLTFQNIDTAGLDFASLSDGVWQLYVAPAGYISTAGDTTLRRLFGDSNNDGTVNAGDFADFGNVFGATLLGNPFDYDNNGTINAADFAEFGNRFGVTL